MKQIIYYLKNTFHNLFPNILRYICTHFKHTYPHLIIATAILGTLNHFLYFLSGHSAIVALFCPINESVWEHLKLLFFPFLFITIWEYWSRRLTIAHFFYCRYLGVASGMIFIVSFFYTYSGIAGQNFLVLDILTFYFSVILSFYVSEYLSRKFCSATKSDSSFVASLWIVTAFFFFVFTCLPPDLPLFYSP